MQDYLRMPLRAVEESLGETLQEGLNQVTRTFKVGRKNYEWTASIVVPVNQREGFLPMCCLVDIGIQGPAADKIWFEKRQEIFRDIFEPLAHAYPVLTPEELEKAGGSASYFSGYNVPYADGSCNGVAYEAYYLDIDFVRVGKENVMLWHPVKKRHILDGEIQEGVGEAPIYLMNVNHGSEPVVEALLFMDGRIFVHRDFASGYKYDKNFFHCCINNHTSPSKSTRIICDQFGRLYRPLEHYEVLAEPSHVAEVDSKTIYLFEGRVFEDVGLDGLGKMGYSWGLYKGRLLRKLGAFCFDINRSDCVELIRGSLITDRMYERDYGAYRCATPFYKIDLNGVPTVIGRLCEYSGFYKDSTIFLLDGEIFAPVGSYKDFGFIYWRTESDGTDILHVGPRQQARYHNAGQFFDTWQLLEELHTKLAEEYKHEVIILDKALLANNSLVKVGDCVVVKGLKGKRAVLNGKKGIVVEIDRTRKNVQMQFLGYFLEKLPIENVKKMKKAA